MPGWAARTAPVSSGSASWLEAAGEADGDPAVLAAPGGLDGADGEVEVVQDGADRAEEGLMRRW